MSDWSQEVLQSFPRRRLPLAIQDCVVGDVESDAALVFRAFGCVPERPELIDPSLVAAAASLVKRECLPCVLPIVVETIVYLGPASGDVVDAVLSRLGFHRPISRTALSHMMRGLPPMLDSAPLRTALIGSLGDASRARLRHRGERAWLISQLNSEQQKSLLSLVENLRSFFSGSPDSPEKERLRMLVKLRRWVHRVSVDAHVRKPQ